MQASENLTAVMQHFGQLSEAERGLFLSVVSNNKTEKPKKTKTRKKNNLPYEYSEEYFFNDLIENHNSKAKKNIQKHQRDR